MADATDDIVLRQAEHRDVAAIGRLGAELMRAHHAFDPGRFMKPGPRPERGYAWFLETQLDDPDAVIFVAERAGAVIGYVYAAVEPRSWEMLRDEAGVVHDLVVDAAARGAGVGTALLGKAVDWLGARGLDRVVLWTAERNDEAQRLFQRLGFRRTMIEMMRGPR